MSKLKEVKEVKEVKLVTNDLVETAMPAPVPEAKLLLQEVDRMALELAKSKRQTALAEAKTALANNDNAELSYKYVVLQLYMKYGLTERDAITETGEILKDGALQMPQSK